VNNTNFKVENKVRKNFTLDIYKIKDFKLLLMCLPAIVLIFIFSYVPMVGLVIAFKDYRFDKGILGSSWVGLQNFKFFIFSNNAWRITRNTVGFNLVFIFLGMLVAVIFALMLNEIMSKNIKKVYQTIMFLPYFLSWVVVGYMLYAFLNENYGILNKFLAIFGIKKISWYMDAMKWIILLPIIEIWKTAGYNTVIYYAGLMNIDSAYYEAAALDGANKWQMTKYISIPHITPLIVMTSILGIGKIFNSDFGLFFQATRDISALYPVTDVLDTYVYRALRVTGDIGMSSAVGFYQSVVGFCLVMLSNYITRKINNENAIF
jgi:putative aldouronate transport system permease protein